MQDYKIKIKIGEFSKLCYVTVKTLRHYEKMGLLIPHEVDEWTGYRYYGVDQMQEMNNIMRLKRLGMRLEEIKDLIDQGRAIPTMEMVDQAIVKAHSELNTLRVRIADLEQMRRIAANSKTFNYMNNITIKPLPGGTVVSFRKKLKSYDELGPLCCNVIAPEMTRLGCICPGETAYCFTVDHNKNFDPNCKDVEYCEIVKGHCTNLVSDIIQFKEIPVVDRAVCFSHYGGYNTFDGSMTELMKYMEEHHLPFAGLPRFSYIHGVWDCNSVEDWLTEIQIPIP